MQKRSLFKKIFGLEQPREENKKNYELLSDFQGTFTPWGQQLINSDMIRSYIRPKVNAFKRLNIKHMFKGESEEDDLVEVLKNPNPHMTFSDFISKIIWQMELTNNAFAYVKRDGFGKVQELYPIPFSQIELLDGEGEVFVRFRFRNGKNMVVPYSDCIHLRKDFAENDFFGSDAILPLVGLMEVINTTDQGIVKNIKNSAVIRWIMKFPNTLQPNDKKFQISEFIKNYLSVENDGGVIGTDPRYSVEQVKQQTFEADDGVIKEYKSRLRDYFGTSEKIVQNSYTEDDWLAFYEQEIEPVVIQLSNLLTNVFFTFAERKQGHKIILEASNLAYASMQTKLNLVQFVDRGIMSPNEVRTVLNLHKIDGGDDFIRRLDTAKIDNNLNIKKDIKGGEGDKEDRI